MIISMRSSPSQTRVLSRQLLIGYPVIAMPATYYAGPRCPILSTALDDNAAPFGDTIAKNSGKNSGKKSPAGAGLYDYA